MESNIYQKPVTARSVLAITIPTILMMVIQSSYAMVDGIFIANLLGAQALSSLTLISPYFNLFIAIAAMFASGGSAIVMRKMGEKREHEAREDFTMLLLCNTAIGLVLTLLVILCAGKLVNVFGASVQVTNFCHEYLQAYGWFVIPQLLFSNLQVYTIACGDSRRAMRSAFLGGILNIVLDALLIQGLGLGMNGAAVASGMGMLLPCILLGRRFWSKSSLLHLVQPVFRPAVLGKTITNGFSEFSSNLVSGVVMLLFNGQMLAYAGENGVAASTITFYVFSLMSAVYMGYMFGIAPMLSYYYGAQETANMRKLCIISIAIIVLTAAVTTLLSRAGSPLLVTIFADPQSAVYTVAVNGNRLFSLALLFVGFNTFSSMLFTALSNGRVSAVISFSRTFIFLAGMIILLPLLLGVDGLWLAVPMSEAAALLLSIYFYCKYQKIYHY